MSPEPSQEPAILTLGHSTRGIGEFLGLLRGHAVDLLIDVRTVPRSRHNPQFNQDSLPAALHGAQIGYEHSAGLGGFRRTSAASPNTGWRNLSFRGYADYMQTAEFAEHLAELIDRASHRRIALMCAEAVPWRCHRSLIADALIARGQAVAEIVSPSRVRRHNLTSFARVSGGMITYPPDDAAPEPGPAD